MKEADLAEHVDGGLALGGSVNLLHGAPEHWPVEGYPKEEQSPTRHNVCSRGANRCKGVPRQHLLPLSITLARHPIPVAAEERSPLPLS